MSCDASDGENNFEIINSMTADQHRFDAFFLFFCRTYMTNMKTRVLQLISHHENVMDMGRQRFNKTKIHRIIYFYFLRNYLQSIFVIA